MPDTVLYYRAGGSGFAVCTPVFFEVCLGSSSGPIVVYTDHNPLVFLHRVYDQNRRLMRWALIVQGYSLVIRHKKGSENMCADALSRV